MERDRLEPLITAEQIAARVQEMGRQITETYGDEPVTCIGVLKGSILFMADLIRAIDCDCRTDFLGVSSYEGMESTGQVRLTLDLRERIEGQHVLIIEDIIDSGLTLEYLVRVLEVRNPASLRIATLLDKPSRRLSEVHVDFVGFSIPDHFVVGYGLDLDERYRNVPYIAIYHP